MYGNRRTFARLQISPSKTLFPFNEPMVTTLSLYVDDSGTRHPDHGPKTHGSASWFGLGGILVREPDEERVRDAHAQFCSRWPQIRGAPLHSNEIRYAKGVFGFLGLDREVRNAFMDDLTQVLTAVPVLGHACVIDRAGYMARYDLYGERRWLLCKTAFCVLLERVAKYALLHGAKLRVYVERSDKVTDSLMGRYYDELRSTGMPFDSSKSAKYGPLDAHQLAGTLYDLKFKNKSSPLMQFADLYLWPICKAAYDANRPYDALRNHGRLIDCVVSSDQIAELGVKYSCFDTNPALCSTLFATG
jgi:hypothetical protein